MNGRKLPDNSDVREASAGDYFFVDWAGPRQLWFLDPNGNPGRVTKHTVTEHDDGTVSVSPSIDGEGWHGYLQRGVWRSA
jgi:hypothetical protein